MRRRILLFGDGPHYPSLLSRGRCIIILTFMTYQDSLSSTSSVEEGMGRLASSYGTLNANSQEETDEFLTDGFLMNKTEDNVPEKQYLSPRLFATTCGREPSADLASSGKTNAMCNNLIAMPWSRSYQSWWMLTVWASVATFFFETYYVAFSFDPVFRPYQAEHFIVEYGLTAIFMIDMFVQARLAYYNHRDELELNPHRILLQYIQRGHFWIDLVAILPLEFIVLALEGSVGQASNYVRLFRLARLLRLYRIRDCFEILSIDTRISLMTLTLVRNLVAAFFWVHVAACTMFFIAKQSDDVENSFLGYEGVHEMTPMHQYVTSLYWATVTWSTVGYGDFVAHNMAEKIWAVFYILISTIVQAWIIGSITLLLLKKDEKTGAYRDALETFAQYSRLHSFDSDFDKRLKTQLQLDFNTREIADEYVLQHFPTSIRRKVLRRLYLPYLLQTDLMKKDVRVKFVDAFLSASKVEIFSPGEEIIRRNAISSELYLLVGGEVEIVVETPGAASQKKKTGEFLNEIGFFTQSPEVYTVRTITVVKTLTISNASYKLLCQDHPGSVGKILQNLLDKVRKLSKQEEQLVSLPQSIDRLRAGSNYYDRTDSSMSLRSHDTAKDGPENARKTLTAVEDLVELHILRLKDDHTTRFLNSAARGDTQTLSVMCDQGFDPNSSDYDSRTALMVASMKGNPEAVKKLLECGADPNMVDMNGSTALYEAARMGHEGIMRVLLDCGASLCMSDLFAASTLDQAVFDGDIALLRRLLEAKIPVNAADYDQRRPVHIAAAEGNIAALKLMLEHGADLTVTDRWGNTARNEAERVKAGPLLQYLDELQ